MGFPNPSLEYKGYSPTPTAFKEIGQNLSDPLLLKRIQSLDYVLLEEAKELNRLDVFASQRMKPHFEGLKANMFANSTGLDCCVNACLKNAFWTNSTTGRNR